MQARTAWTPPTGALGRLTQLARARAEALGAEAEWQLRATNSPTVMSLRGALSSGAVAVIAEVKRRSPSRGALDDTIDAPRRARQYHDGGARAISVLTEPSEFGGSSEDLEAVRRLVSCPLIKKDFHVLPVQMFEARAIGASAALLIVRALGPDDTRVMADAARQAGIEPVFEVRDEVELAWAVESGAQVIGVNRRNLETLAMEPNVTSRLIPMIPTTVLAIAESGITNRVDVEDVAELGADAVLVGSALSVSPNPEQAVAALDGRAAGTARVTEVKFCGLTRDDDVREAVRLGAAFVGAIMTESARRVTPQRAREMFASVEGTAVKRVGVFGNEPFDWILEAARVAGVDIIQLHGWGSGTDPDLHRLKSAVGVEIWRVLRIGPEGLTSDQRSGASGADGLLLDTMSTGALGGTGVTFRWDLVAADVRALQSTTRIILAGGLRPENVRDAIDLLLPDVVDVSSGVESQPGIKDHSRMAAFMDAVRHKPAPSAS